MRTLARRPRPLAPLVLLCSLAVAAPAAAGPAKSNEPFLAGAATADITPPPWTAESDAAFVPACGPDPATISQAWPGDRPFAFEEPYIDQSGSHRYAPGDLYCDANHNGRYDAPYIAGGSGQNHWPTTADANPIRAQVLVFGLGTTKIALVVVDSI